MRIALANPLALLALQHGMSRPLDRNDFRGGHVPDWAGRHMARPGQMNWGGQGYADYMGSLANVGVLAGENAGGSIYDFGTKQLFALGAIGVGRDGRIFRYASAGATALVEGTIVQSAAPVANHLALTSAAQAIGDGPLGKPPIVVTPGATGGAANLYSEGTLVVDTTPNNGYTYGIAGHPTITSSVAFNLALYPDDAVTTTAWTTSTRYGLHHNPYKTLIISPTTATALTVGGAVINITANTTSENFGWIQTRGPFACLINGTPGVGIGVVISATTAGAVDVAAVAAEINVRIIGRMMQVGVSGKNNSVFLTLD